MTVHSVANEVQYIDSVGRRWVPAQPSEAPKPDAINPPHYKKPGAVEVVDVIRQQLGDAGFVAYCRGNALKYLARAGAKPGQPAAQDFAKSAWFARMAAHALEPDRYPDPRLP
ncbi:DUF3310 domain-containing protein [Gemmatimonas sp.]|uniref:DUF3310 domain-containing protein n=1 Tax=Gemmatimonas sp. TaxID=1962908 RepID=UPI0025C32C4F|nr:DUF3310 domain-containing protein [Gemmatimonas sp.]MCA2991951.1 DUF3310 domain-containing protein [Gemmatimonas sp.]